MRPGPCRPFVKPLRTRTRTGWRRQRPRRSSGSARRPRPSERPVIVRGLRWFVRRPWIPTRSLLCALLGCWLEARHLGFQIPDSRFQIPNEDILEIWNSDSGSGIRTPDPEFGLRTPDPEFGLRIWNLESGLRIWNLESGIWNLDSGLWTPEFFGAVRNPRRSSPGPLTTGH